MLEIRTPYLAGGRLMWETPIDGFRIGASVQTLRLDAKLLAGATAFDVQIPATLAVGSLEYSLHDVLVAAEYSRWFVSSRSTHPELFRDTPLTVSERGYAMVAYRVASWFQPGAYYSLYFPDVDHREGRASRQHDVAAMLRFDFNDHWLLKLEGHYMAGTAALNPALNDNVPTALLERTWAVFLAKTTAYF